MRRPLLLVLTAIALAPPAGPSLAHGGVFLGFSTGFYAPPPSWYYVPPPAYYYYIPPPLPPPPAYAYPGYGYVPPVSICRAGAWTCPLAVPAQTGDPCACPTPRGPAWGRVGG